MTIQVLGGLSVNKRVDFVAVGPTWIGKIVVGLGPMRIITIDRITWITQSVTMADHKANIITPNSFNDVFIVNSCVMCRA